MATSGSYVFQVTRDDVIQSALRLCGVYGANDTPDAADVTACALALNILVKNLMMDGWLLHAYQTFSFAQVAAKQSYTISTAGGADVAQPRPERIAQMWARDANNFDQPVQMLTRNEYNLLSPKNTTGPITNAYYDPQIVTGVLYVWPVPADTSKTIFVSCQRPFQDMLASGNNFDFPQEYFSALKWMLADEIMLEYGAPARMIEVIMQKAAMYRAAAADWITAEEPVTYFTPEYQTFSSSPGDAGSI